MRFYYNNGNDARDVEVIMAGEYWSCRSANMLSSNEGAEEIGIDCRYGPAWRNGALSRPLDWPSVRTVLLEKGWSRLIICEKFSGALVLTKLERACRILFEEYMVE